MENEVVSAFRHSLELLNSLRVKISLPYYQLKLNRRLIVMLSKNVDPSFGHSNYAQYVVGLMNRSVQYLALTTRKRKRASLALPRMICSRADDRYPVLGFIRYQFSVCVYFAMTTNKSQGQLIGNGLGLDLPWGASVRANYMSHSQGRPSPKP